MVIPRLATRRDITGMHAVRMAVHENRLTSTTLDETDYGRLIETDGRGFVVEENGDIVAFAIGNAATGNLWALFVHPDHEHRGYGTALHDPVVDWLWEQGLDRLWLTTQPGTRAAVFYEQAGWQRREILASGESTATSYGAESGRPVARARTGSDSATGFPWRKIRA